jgi:hypothetical protein
MILFLKIPMFSHILDEGMFNETFWILDESMISLDWLLIICFKYLLLCDHYLFLLLVDHLLKKVQKI